ncbi:MAG: hypothetical protein ACTSR2_14130 [Candidatus Hodarchaeales archaeon]
MTFPTLFRIPMLGIVAIIYSTIFTGGIIPLVLYYFGLRWSKASVGGLAELAFPLLAVFVFYFSFGSSVSMLSYINAKEYGKRGS